MVEKKTNNLQKQNNNIKESIVATNQAATHESMSVESLLLRNLSHMNSRGAQVKDCKKSHKILGDMHRAKKKNNKQQNNKRYTQWCVIVVSSVSLQSISRLRQF